MDECAICAHPQAPHAELPGVYITTDHLDPEDRSSYFVCGDCVFWILDALVGRGETRVRVDTDPERDRPEET